METSVLSGMPSPFLILLLVSSSNLEVYMSMKSSDFFLRINMKYMPYTDTDNMNLLLQKYTSTTTTAWLYSRCKTLASFTTNFQSSLLCARVLQFVTPILLRPSLMSSIHLNLLVPELFFFNFSTPCI